MDYVAKLTEQPEYLDKVCQIIGAKEFKKHFQYEPIKKGLSMNRMNDATVLSLVKQVIKRPKTSKFVNAKIESMMNSIKEAKDKYESKGISKYEALMKAINESPFGSDYDFYFYLEEPSRSESERELLLFVFDSLKIKAEHLQSSGQEATAEDKEINGDSTEAANKEHTELEHQIEQLKQQIEDESTANQAALSDSKDKIDALTAEKAQLQQRVLAMQQDVDKLHKLQNSAVNNSKALQKCDEPFHSVCLVYWSDGKLRLDRRFDVKDNYISDGYDETYPAYEKLFTNIHNSKLSEGHIGLWDWHTKPLDTDRTRDYIESAYNVECQPAEVVVVDDCANIKQVVSEIVEQGIPAIACDNLFLCYYTGKRYQGIYCEKQQLNSVGDMMRLRDTVVSLPVFETYPSEILTIDNHKICSRLDYGMPVDIVRVKDPLEILRDFLLSRITWNVSKQQNITKATHQQIIAYLTNVPTQEFTKELAEKCDCSESEAATLIENFKAQASSYLDNSSIEDSILIDIVRGSDDLLQRSKEMLRAEWEQETASKLAEAKGILNDKKNAIKSAEGKLNALQKQYDDISNKLKESNAELADRERLASEVEAKVAERITAAQKNAAEFIAAQAFIGHTTANAVVPTVAATSFAKYVAGENLEDPDGHSSDTLKDYLENLSDNLLTAGVGEKYAYDLAIYLHTAYRNGLAVFLVGPNGQSIAQAFSISTFASKAGVLNCTGEYSEQAVNDLTSANDEVVVITNPFSASWSQMLPNIITATNKFFILTAPYAEDLQIEPQGIANYALPVLTEFFVEENSPINCDSYLPGKKSITFADMKDGKSTIYNKEYFAKLKYHSIAINHISKVLCDANAIVGDKTSAIQFRYLFGLFPAAYLSGKLDILNEQFERDKERIGSEFYDWLKPYIGDDQ